MSNDFKKTHKQVLHFLKLDVLNRNGPWRHILFKVQQFHPHPPRLFSAQKQVLNFSGGQHKANQSQKLLKNRWFTNSMDLHF